MATHKMKFQSAEADAVVFACSECGRTLGFHHPDTNRYPMAVRDGDEFVMPQDGADITARSLGEKCDA